MNRECSTQIHQLFLKTQRVLSYRQPYFGKKLHKRGFLCVPRVGRKKHDTCNSTAFCRRQFWCSDFPEKTYASPAIVVFFFKTWGGLLEAACYSKCVSINCCLRNQFRFPCVTLDIDGTAGKSITSSVPLQEAN